MVNSRHGACIGREHMKTYLHRFALVTVTAFFLNPGWAYSADTTPPGQATPGSAESQDSKNQENTPSGPDKQVTAHPKEGTKKKKHKTHAPDPTGTNQSGDTATKTPQKDSPPSTPNQ